MIPWPVELFCPHHLHINELLITGWIWYSLSVCLIQTTNQAEDFITSVRMIPWLSPTKNVEALLKMYEIYDRHRDSVLWFLEDLDAGSYEEYDQKYAGASSSRCHFTTVCGFFELSGVLVNSRLIDQKLYFDVFNPAPFWEKCRVIVEGMRNHRPHIYENFESLNSRRLEWQKKRKDKRGVAKT